MTSGVKQAQEEVVRVGLCVTGVKRGGAEGSIVFS